MHYSCRQKYTAFRCLIDFCKQIFCNNFFLIIKKKNIFKHFKKHTIEIFLNIIKKIKNKKLRKLKIIKLKIIKLKVIKLKLSKIKKYKQNKILKKKLITQKKNIIKIRIKRKIIKNNYQMT